LGSERLLERSGVNEHEPSCWPSIYAGSPIKIWVNGCFDILHRGHVELFKFAKRRAPNSRLTVGVDTDERVKFLKGPTRPRNKLEDRIFMLESLSLVDEVVSFGTDSGLEVAVETLNPDFMVVGADHKDKPVIGAQHAKNLIFFDRIENYSSSKLLDLN